MVHVIDITYVARGLMKASQHNSAPLKACTRCCTVHHYLFQEKERKIKPFTKHKHLLVFIDLHFQFFFQNINVLCRFTVHVFGL